MSDTPPPSVVITGASTGIGATAAAHLAARGWRVFPTVRRQADADRLLVQDERLEPLIADVCDNDAVLAAAQTVSERLGSARLTALVNNAGIVGAGPLLHIDVEEVRQVLDVNVLGIVRATQAFAPLLGTDEGRRGEPGRIVNISSSSGRVAFPFMGAYCASKHAVEALSQSLRRELRLYGVDVVVIAPGPIKTPIFEKSKAAATGKYEQTDYGAALETLDARLYKQVEKGLPVEQMSVLIERVLRAAHPKPRYRIVPSTVEQLAAEWMPTGWLDSLIAKQLGLIRR